MTATRSTERRRWSAGRILATVLFAGVAAAVASAAWAATVAYRAGSIRVAVEPEDGGRYAVVVPAVLADVAVGLLPRDELSRVGAELRPLLAPAAAAIDALEEAPDFDLVEVRSDGGLVSVRKVGGRLAVEVDHDGARVRVSLPLRSIERLVDRLG